MPLVFACACHLSLVLASVVQGDAVNCNAPDREVRGCLATALDVQISLFPIFSVKCMIDEHKINKMKLIFLCHSTMLVNQVMNIVLLCLYLFCENHFILFVSVL